MATGELRIHGVSGTPPEAMLGIGARVIDGESPSGVQVFDAPPSTAAHAFSWGGLTSGKPINALWLVLLPFVLINAAGWTLYHDAAHGVSERVRVMLLRVAALASTVLTVQLAMIALLDVVGLQWLHDEHGLPDWPGWLDVLDRAPGTTAVTDGAILWARVGVAATLLLLGLLWYLTRVRTPSRPGTHPALGSWDGAPSRHDDLTLRCRIDDPNDPMWSQAGLIQRMRTLHIAAALGAAAFTAGMVADGGPWVSLEWTVIRGTRWWEPFTVDLQLAGDPWLLVAGGGLVVVALVLLAVRSLAGPVEWRWWRRATRVVGWLGIPVGVAALVLVSPRTTEAFGSLRIAATLTAIVFAALAFSLGGVEMATRWLRRGARPRRGGLVAPGLALLGLAVIGAAGSSAEMLLANWGGGGGCLDGSTPTPDDCLDVGVGAFSLALTYAAGLMVLLGTAAVWFLVVGRGRFGDGRWWRPPPPERDTGDENLKVLREMLTRPATWFGWMIGFALAGTVTAIVVLARGGTKLLRALAEVRGDAPLLLDVVAWSVPVVVLLWIVALTLSPLVRGLAVLGLGAAVAWSAFATDGLALAGVPVVPVGSRQVVLWLGLLGPVVVILLRARTGWSDPAARRQLGILWDLGLFWPRWFHPFTPPTYSDRAVTEFRDQVRQRITSPAGGEPGQLVVSAHSQGSVIAVAALATMAPEELARVALVTYGAPVGRLYGELFSPSIDGPLLVGLRDRLTGTTGVRWRNLHRTTDPIGGPMVGPHQYWLHDSPGLRDSQWAPVEAPPGGQLLDPDHGAHSGYQFTDQYAEVFAALAGQLEGPGGGGPSTQPWGTEVVEAGDGIRHTVWSSGVGPDVVLLHELSGAGPQLFALAEQVRAAGYRVHVPVLYGPAGRASPVLGPAVRARVCLWRELHLFATARTSPLVFWLRDLCARLPGSPPNADVAVIGMCMTGGLVLGVLGTPEVVAGVVAQPSLPIVLPVPGWRTRASRSIGLGPVEAGQAGDADTPVLLSRFADDPLSPSRRADEIVEALTPVPCEPVPHPELTVCRHGDEVTRVEVPGSGHSTLTTPAPLTPALQAMRTQLFAFLAEHHPPRV